MDLVYENIWTTPPGAHIKQTLPGTNHSYSFPPRRSVLTGNRKRMRHFLELLHHGTIALAFQPILSSDTDHTPLYYETLLWQADCAGTTYASASHIIPPLEREGLIERLDACVLRTIIQVLQEHPTVHLGCNLSPLTLKHGPWWQSIFSTLQQQPDVAHRLILEITESACPSNPDDASLILQTLRDLGCRIALDDLGTGFNTLDLAWHLQPDLAKLDKSLVHCARSPQGFSRLHRLIESLRPLCGVLVAEGIETDEDLDRVAGMGVQAVQGYLTGKPSLLPDCRPLPVSVHDFFRSTDFQQ